MFDNILAQKDESQLFYDYKVDKKKVIGHGFGSSTRFIPNKEKNFKRALSTLDVNENRNHQRDSLMPSSSVKSGHSRAVSHISQGGTTETKLPEIFNKLGSASTKHIPI